MRHGNWLIAVVAACLMGGLMGGLGLATGAAALDDEFDIPQFKLTAEQIKGLVAAQPELAAMAERLEKLEDDSDVSVQKELNGIAEKHGFKDFDELDDVSANVQLVLDGIDPETGEYSDPLIGLKEELEEVKADKELPKEERKALIEELEEAMTALPPLKYKENVELVQEHQKLIQKALDAGDGDN
jgi:hypothetical protein